MVMTIEEYEKNGTEAEKALIAACREGRVCKRNGGKLPAEGDKHAPVVRADLIRALALEKTSLHEKGVWLEGALITDVLDLSFAKCRGRLALYNCRFEEEPLMAQAELAQLSLQGSHLHKGLFAQGAKVTGSVFLRGAKANGEVDLNNARIGGQLDCEGATFENAGGSALNAQGMRVKEGFLFREVAAVQGWIDLTSAHVDVLADDVASWAMCDAIILDGFIYDRIDGTDAPKTFAARKDWLAKGSVFNGEFYPQPYTQFAKVMRAAGHETETRKALAERDTILFQVAQNADRDAYDEARKGDLAQGDMGKIWLRLQARRIWAWLSRNIIGHGHKPHFALLWLAGLWLIGAVVYFIAYRAGLMVPNSDVILVSDEWLRAVKDARLSPTGVWTGDGVLASVHYESFFAGIYALDLFLPIVDLGQESAWAVTTPVDFGWGWWLRVATFLYQVMGWLVTSLGIAAVTGFVQRDKPE